MNLIPQRNHRPTIDQFVPLQFVSLDYAGYQCARHRHQVRSYFSDPIDHKSSHKLCSLEITTSSARIMLGCLLHYEKRLSVFYELTILDEYFYDLSIHFCFNFIKQFHSFNDTDNG